MYRCLQNKVMVLHSLLVNCVGVMVCMFVCGLAVDSSRFYPVILCLSFDLFKILAYTTLFSICNNSSILLT